MNESILRQQITESTENDETDGNTLFESIDLSDRCFVCVYYKEGKCGTALYHTSSHSIQLINEFEDNDFQSLELILTQTEANHLIISSKSDPKLIEILKLCSNQTNETINESIDNSISDLRDRDITTSDGMTKGDNSFASELIWKMDIPFELHIVSHTLFGYEKAKNRILSVNIENDLNFRDETQKILYFSSLMEFSENNTFKAFGALLRFLDFNGADIQTENNRSTALIKSISRFYLRQSVTIERNTFESLQIFQQEWHPSAAKQGINQKEGLSLYGLFNCCVSKVGANYLRKIFLLPTQEINIILDRHLIIDFFIDPNNHVLRDNLIQHLKQIKNINSLFNRLLSHRTLSVNDCHILYNNLLNGLRIRDLIAQQKNDLKIFKQIKENFIKEMDILTNILFKTIDFDKSIRRQSFEINYGIDKLLDEMKYTYTHLPDILNDMALREQNMNQGLLSDCNCVYVPQMGFMTTIPAVDWVRPPHTINEEIKFLVKNGDRYYYKTKLTLELDKKFGDIYSDIIDRQIQIIDQLLEILIDKKNLFVKIVRYCSKLDAFIAMSRTALTYGYTKPIFSSNGLIEIIGGRHPLMELMSVGFTPNDYMSGAQHKKVKLISGPNACGKSVYLKQNCLIVYLAHIGSYVPATSASIPLVDRIFTRICTPESITLRLSTFMLDLRQMSNATKNATKRSLVVIDEFGKGTQPNDGIALMTASINHWLDGVEPHLIISSHFRCLPSIIKRMDLIETQTFEFIRNETELKYLFKLTNGHFKDNIASQIALIANIPQNIIIRGLELCELMAANKSIDCLDNQQINIKSKTYEGIGEKFLGLNLSSDEVIKSFFEFNFSEHSVSEE